mgnify:CR=1 FL=1
MILITGGTGFVGKALVDYLLNEQIKICLAVRKRVKSLPDIASQVELSNMSPTFNWSRALHSVSTIIHLAARVHIMNDNDDNPLAEFRKVNTEVTLNLARQAADAGVKRFVFISSVKVNGEATMLGSHFRPEDRFIPDDPYGLSKYEAEQGLLAIAKETGMEVVIIRPPLIYGPGVKANFYNLLKLSHTKLPLPFACVNNKRSMVYLGNLVEFIILCIDHPHAANQTFLVSEGT